MQQADQRLMIFIMMIVAVISISACTPATRYAVNVTPEPVRNIVPAGEKMKGIYITVTAFNDLRTLADKSVVGTVTKSEGEKIPVMLANTKPADAVTSGVKSYLTRAGYTLVNLSPAWDLKPSGIGKYWGRYVIGGNIESFEIACDKTAMKAKYKTRVTLSMALADVQKAAVIHTYRVQGESNREDVNLTEDDLRKHLTIEVNNALTDALEKLINPKSIDEKILASGGDKKP
jgi:hypothetical protein